MWNFKVTVFGNRSKNVCKVPHSASWPFPGVQEVQCHLQRGQDEYTGQQEAVSFSMPNIVLRDVWTTFVICAESTTLFNT